VHGRERNMDPFVQVDAVFADLLQDSHDYKRCLIEAEFAADRTAATRKQPAGGAFSQDGHASAVRDIGLVDEPALSHGQVTRTLDMRPLTQNRQYEIVGGAFDTNVPSKQLRRTGA